jgi:hypothetical protein
MDQRDLVLFKMTKDKTALVLPTDHGHGDTVKAWTSHGNKFEGSSGIYFAAMGPKIEVGEIKIESQLYQNEFAQTMAKNTFEVEQPKKLQA